MEKLLDEIESYWSTRTEGYSEVNHKELAGTQKNAWLKVLTSQFPDKPKEEIRILDIGTGPGFFAILLAEAGYQVTAVDYTEEMLKEAQSNAGGLAGCIVWKTGDAQALDVESNSFDAVVTRNVTWNLPRPDLAYKEWLRVLKPEGVLYNFDADWYGHLYNEEKRSSYEKDRRQTEEQNVEDYYSGTDSEKMEEIARQVPLSRLERPKWDIETMQKAGFLDVSCDEKVWKEVWTEEEIINNSSSPIFLFSGRKREAFHLKNITVEPGEKWSGELELANGDIRLPATVLHGHGTGKTMLITAGVHAGEYVGIQAAIELSQKLKIEKVNGTIIIIKVMNRPAFEARNGSMGLDDGKNLNREFPGNPDGTEMERLAWAISQELQPAADYYIDLHSGDDYEKLIPYVYYAGAAAGEVVSLSRQMAEQVDVPYMVKSNVASGGSYNYAASQGIPSILIERGGMGDWTYEEVRSTRRDVRNILCHLGIYQGLKDFRTYYPLDVADVRYQDAEENGLWYPFKKVGDMIQEGDILGEVRDYEGNVKEVSVAEFDGVLLYQCGTLQVLGNGPMVTYGRIVSRYDERKERIVNYWEKRSDSFLVQKRQELHSAMAERWMKEIRGQLPEGKKLRILDVGCGAGFFSILLAKEGYQVTGIDLTPDMIKNARLLAEEEKVSCEFQVMDAENPEFQEETFDVVISRNLTWTLPHVQHAYQEWIRVLKKGGILLNFDANWYAYLYDDKLKLGYEQDRQRAKEEQVEDYYEGTDIAWMENIAKQVPLSPLKRPKWDLDILKKIGFDCWADETIGERVLSDAEKINYQSTPVFMVCAVK